MTKVQKMFLYLSALFVAIAIGIYLYFEVSESVTLIYGAVAAAVLLLLVVITNMATKEKISDFQSKMRDIWRIYDAVMVNTNNLPDLSDRNIIKVVAIENLIDAQMGIRKPIYYKDYTDSCAYVLLGEKEACVLILKEDPSVVCPYEKVIEDSIKNKDEEDIDHKLLDNIDKTTVIKIDGNKELKVSPIREEK